jgi:hypothetical protein
MRSTLRILALAVILLLVLVPLVAQADDDGPCPDDPELSKDCYPEAPPFFVVINRDFEDLDRPGTGCQPIILKNPDCEQCCDGDDSCKAASVQLEEEVCPMLADKWDGAWRRLLVEVVAEKAGMSEEELWSRLNAGDTFEEIMNEIGFDCQLVFDVEIVEWLNEAVAAGNLSRADADRILTEVQSLGEDICLEPFTDTVLVYEMCCDCATYSDGMWYHNVRELDALGNCPIVEECVESLPPGTGIDLPAPVIIGGLAAIGAVLLAAGLLVRRRTLRVA